MSAVNSYCIGHIKKWSLHPLSSLLGLDSLVIQIRKMNKPHLDVFRAIRDTNQESVLPIILILHWPFGQLVKCPSSQGQNKRNALSQYVCNPFRKCDTKIGIFLEERSILTNNLRILTVKTSLFSSRTSLSYYL